MPPELIPQLIPLGPTVVLVVLLFFSDKERKKLQDIVSEQVEDKRTMRDERARLEKIMEEHYTINARTLALLERLEKKLNRS